MPPYNVLLMIASVMHVVAFDFSADDFPTDPHLLSEHDLIVLGTQLDCTVSTTGPLSRLHLIPYTFNGNLLQAVG